MNVTYLTLRAFAEAMAQIGIHTAGDLMASGKVLREVKRGQ
jgi:hypothetical protein